MLGDKYNNISSSSLCEERANSFYILTFSSSTNAVAAKKSLESAPKFLSEGNKTLYNQENLEQYNFRLIPIPPEIDASCGLCMKIEDKKFENQDRDKSENKNKNQSKNQYEEKIEIEKPSKSVLKILDILKAKKIQVSKIYRCKHVKEGLLCTILTMPQPQ